MSKIGIYIFRKNKDMKRQWKRNEHGEVFGKNWKYVGHEVIY
jgi:hypothetical protein